MLKRFSATLTVGLAAAHLVAADFIQLKDQAAVSGTILAEKADHIAVDLGFTVLNVPRRDIVRIFRGEEGAPKSAAAKTSPKAAAKSHVPARPATEREFFTAAAAATSERTVQEWVGQLGEAVVQVRTPGGLGSGFFINEEGYLITNFHVVENETKISLEVYRIKAGQLDRQSFKDIRIVALNKFHDLALLKVEDREAGRFAWVPLGDPDRLAVGDRVFAIGSPLGLERTVTEGMLSSKTREMQGNLYLQSTAPINPGNSGGPLFNLRGEVVGVTNMKLNFGEGLGFAIPADIVKYFLKNRDAFAYDNENPANAFRYLEPPSRIKKSGPKADRMSEAL